MTFQKTLRRDLHYSTVDNFFFSVMVGAGETFLPAFALAMGLSEVTAGMIAALPFLIGSALQLAAPRALAFVGSYRRWLSLLGIVQGLSFLPLAFFAVRGQGIEAWVLYLVVTLYWACGLASGPAWSSWMTALVPQNMRPKYFAKRNRLGQAGLLIGLVGGGTLLHFAKQGGWEVPAFAALFIASGLFRIASTFCLAQKSDCPSSIRHQKRIPVHQVMRRLSSGQDGKVIGFLLLFAVAVNFSSPYFNPFMLKKLGLSYGPYMLLIAASFVAKLVTFSFLGRFAKGADPYKLMRYGVLGTAILPVLWTLSPNFIFLVGVNVATGVAWAVYDLGVMLVLFGAIRDEERTSFLSYYNFASALMILLGTTLGGKILTFFGEGSTSYFMVFGLSAALRFLSVIYFDQVMKDRERTLPVGVERAQEPGVAASGVERRTRGDKEVESAS